MDPNHVIDLVADNVHWLREEHVKGDGELLKHPDFEGTLVVNEPLLNEAGDIVGWKTRTGGGARTNYEKATPTVIDRLIELDPSVADMRSDRLQINIGLKASGKRDRPPKR